MAQCWEREKILPARGKWPDFGVFGCAGRVLYRLGSVVGVAGRVLYRLGQGRLLLGEFCTGCWLVPRAERVVGGVPGGFCTGRGGGVPVMGVGWCCCGRKFSLLGGAVLGTGKNSPCSREMAGFRCFWACRESFVPVGSGGGCCRESFVPVVPCGGCCRESFVPGEWWIGVGSGRKFSLLGGAVLGTGKNSPYSREMAGFRCFWACWESFVPGGPVRGARWGRVCCVEPR